MSGPLALIRQDGVSGSVCLNILGGLEHLRINLAFAAMTTSASGNLQLSYCVEQADSTPAYNHSAPIALRNSLPEPEIIEPVVAFDLFPRGKELDFMLAVESALVGAGLAPLSLGSSQSAVVAVLYHDQAGAAVDVICGGFGLSKEAAHLKERVAIRQTD